MAFPRRTFLKVTSGMVAGSLLSPTFFSCNDPKPPDLPFKISLAQWSLHKKIRAGDLDNLDFPSFTKKKFGIEAVEYVNQFFSDKASDKAYLTDLKTRANDLGVKNLLIMIDEEGNLGNQDEAERKKAVENHYKWVEAAQFLDCHSIRVNAGGQGEPEDVKSAAVESLTELSEFAKPYNINVIVENHGGYSSNGDWLSDAISKVGLPNCGILPDFGNFTIDDEKGIIYDKYKGVEQFMPFAKAVSAKCYDFGKDGEETTIDFRRMMKIVLDAGYKGYVGIEYEGSRLSEEKGIIAAKKLLEKVGGAIDN